MALASRLFLVQLANWDTPRGPIEYYECACGRFPRPAPPGSDLRIDVARENQRSNLLFA